MQYYTYTINKYQYWTHADGRRVREGQDANGYFVRDVEITVYDHLTNTGGFADAENVGWEQKSSHSGTLTGNFYKGIKDCEVVLLVGTNPNGTEGVDWESL